MQVVKWQDSLAVALPDELIDRLQLKEGDEVSLEVTAERSLNLNPKMTREEAIELIQKSRWPLPHGFKFDRDEANERR
jgi:antitoxin MazE